MPQRYLMLITFGPVQGFISQARKTADLYAGSQILCELAKGLLNEIGNDSKKSICFPSTAYAESLTNRIVFEMSGNVNEVKETGNGLIDFLKKHWIQLAQKTLGSHFNKSEVKNQIENHLESYWVTVPIGTNYSEAYKSLDKYLAADKNQKSWNKSVNEEFGRKCSLDGTRNALFYRPKEDGKGIASRVTENAIKINDDSLKINEGVSAISYLKRKYGKAQNFPSTSKIALLDILENYRITTSHELFKKNDQLYFEENISNSYFEKSDYNLMDFEKVKREQKQWKEAVKNKNLKTTSYYALLLFDGDAMGQWFSGEFLKDVSEAKLKAFHTILTEALGDFAQKATQYLNEEGRGRGRTIFAGGDDFMGFINLNHLFEVLKKLRELFKTEVNDKLPQDNINENHALTFSAGVAIAHYKQPLAMVIEQVHKMEKKAKMFENKNAYAIGAMVRSGSTDELVLPWYEDDGNITTDFLKTLTEDLAGACMSNTFITMLEQEIRKYGEIPDRELLKNMLSYYFKRSNEQLKPKAKTTEEDIQKLIDWQDADLNKIQATLNICEFISRNIYVPQTENIAHE
jgi:CRISPR-associated protein Cmr2